MGTRWEIDAETPAAFQRPDFAAIYEDQVAAEEVLPGALSMASRNCPVADMKTARWWPWDLPSWRPPAAFG